mgnify:CR=1 FL=1
MARTKTKDKIKRHKQKVKRGKRKKAPKKTKA